MRLLLILLGTGIKSHAQTISFSGKNVPLEQVFQSVKQQTGYFFFYNDQVLKNARPASIQATGMPLEEFLRKLLKDQPLKFSFQNKTIVISRKTSERLLPPAPPPQAEGREDSTAAKTVRIKGFVYNKEGQPLPGASITWKKSGKSVTTNARGEFELVLKSDRPDALLVSFIGYQPQSVNTGTGATVSIVLEAANNDLDKVVIQAYGTTSRRYTTGNIRTVTAEEIQQQPVTNFLSALQGRVPGVLITSANGIPGSGITMQIRGNNSISALSNPLYIVDGIPLPAVSLSNVATASGAVSPFNSINPLDIESVTILKDAEATAIYGSRGANGVVLVTTKKGKAGKTRLEVNAYSGTSVATRVPQFMNTQQYLLIRKKAFAADSITPTVSNAQDLLLWNPRAYTNFPKLILGNTSPLTDVQVSMTGGNESTRILLGMGYHHEGGVLFGSNYDNRVNGHFNIDHHSADKRLAVNTTVTYTNDNIQTLAADPYLSVFAPPNFPLYDSTGRLYWIKGDVTPPLTNPLSYTRKVGKTATDNFIANTSLRYKVLDGLNARVNVGFTKTFMSQQSVAHSSAFNPTATSSTKSSASFGNSSLQTYIAEPQLDYTKRISKGVLNVLAGGTIQSSTAKSNSITGINFTSDNLIESIAAAGTITNKTLTSSQYKYISGFGRVNFRWMDQYLVNGTFRRDGSSRFGPGRRMGNFWSVSGGWIFSEQRFVKEAWPVLSYGKLRSSYGVTGNDQINDYRYLETYTSNAQPYNGNLGLYASNIANPNYGWEVNKKLELGIELGFFKDRILFTSSFYRSRSNNQLIQTPLPSQTGFAYYQANLPALVQNTSWEFELSTTNVNNSTFRWQTVFNLTLPKNTLLAFPGLASSAYASSYVIGQSLRLFRGYRFTGIAPATGVPQFEDVNKDGSLTSTDDYVNVGSLYPTYYGGMGNTFSYKNFSLDLFVQFSKQNGYNALRAFYYPPGYKVNLPAYLVQDYWEPSNPNASRPGLTTSVSSTSPTGYAYIYRLYASSAAYTDASYLRLKNLSFSYSLPSRLAAKLKAQRVRLYIQAQNLFTITPYKGLDPEVQNATPVLKTLTAGIQFTF